MLPALHLMGTDHLWQSAPIVIVAALFVFLGAVAIRTQLERWQSEEEAKKRQQQDESKPQSD